MSEKIFIASDHAGYHLKKQLVDHLSMKHHIADLGTDSDISVDYNNYAEKLARQMKGNKDIRGILICGTGIGMSIAANRFSHIRAALCVDEETAKLTREHNDANVLVLGSRSVTLENTIQIVKTFLQTDFSNEERHIRRVAKLSGKK